MSTYAGGYGLGSTYRVAPPTAPTRAYNFPQPVRYNPPDPTHPTLPFTETWTGSDGDPWPQTDWINYGGTSSIQSNTGQQTPPAGAFGGSMAQAIAMPVVADVEILVDFTAVSTGAEQYPQVALRCDTRHSTNRPDVGYSAFMCYAATPSSGFIQVERQNGSSAIIGAQPAFSFVGGVTYRCRFRAVGADLYLRVWDASTAEPGTWTWTHTDTSPYLSAGQVYLAMSNGADAVARSVRFDDLTISDPATSSGVTGAGALTATAASLSGAGAARVTGSGALAATQATVSGAGALRITGPGTLTATPAALSGTGTLTLTGSGGLTSTPTTLAGSGTTTVAGTGGVAATPANLAGGGSLLATGTGGLTTPPATMSGSGTVVAPGVVGGAGTLTGPTAGMSGLGTLQVVGAAELIAQATTLVASALLTLVGAGELTAPTAGLSGAGTVGGGALTVTPGPGRSRRCLAAGTSRVLLAVNGRSRRLTVRPS